MKTTIRNLALSGLLVVALAVGACAQGQQQQTPLGGPKESVGTLGGAALGGLAGAQIGDGEGRLAATAAGALLGAFIGREVGASLDRADRLHMQRASQRAHSAPLGETITWQNEQSGNRGSITPLRQGHTDSGRLCREYRQRVVIEGREEVITGVACRNASGEWEVVQ